jgi:hypothetical protein
MNDTKILLLQVTKSYRELRKAEKEAKRREWDEESYEQARLRLGPVEDAADRLDDAIVRYLRHVGPRLFGR